MTGEEDNPPKSNTMDPLQETHNLKITTTLTGSENYPLWKRQMELVLSAKRKLGYVTGKVTKPKEDEENIDAWMVSNNKMVWDELENLNTLPTINKITTEIAEYLAAVEAQTEERTFQFLNGLDKQYGMLRSNILMKDPLPTVDDTVSLLLQEEMQFTNMGGARIQENSALTGKGEFYREKCTHCGRDNHKSDLCWEIRGYPVGHPKHKKLGFKPGFKNTQGSGYKQQQKPFQRNVRQGNFKRTTDAHVKAKDGDLSVAIGAATQQLENLLKQVPNSSFNAKNGGESDEELGCNFAGMTNSKLQTTPCEEWIVDSGATNHMTAYLSVLENLEKVAGNPRINLPDGSFVKVTHKGNIPLES
ncbi:hypothetical protein RND81_09G128700 [Saponaria officinalis]|uniref:Retrotransposon Copia-like N-terminal domain-containing protein n=1 Tax=Saponaria officinalis TaxID=3572 RepID=A0AAW1IK61_SAPOF